MSLPLQGQTILVTRPEGQRAGLAKPLEELGAIVFALPAIQILPLEDPTPLHDAFGSGTYDWIVLTSVNGVQALEALDQKERIATCRLAAVGPTTSDAMRRAFREPDAMPAEALGVRIAEVLGDVAGKRILLSRADIARKDLPEALRERGAIVDDVAAYRIVRPSFDGPLPESAPDWITLTSSSAVVGTHDALAARGKEAWMRASRLACIGPLTAATVRELGFEVAVVAAEHTVPGLVDAIVHAPTREAQYA